MTDHRSRAREWLNDTPYLSFHPFASGGAPNNLPMTIATPEKIDSLAALLAAVEREARAEEREAASNRVERMLGNPSPGAWPNVKNGTSWNSAVLRCASAARGWDDAASE